MRILVTGGAGSIGRKLVQRFRDAGHVVDVFDLPDHDVREISQIYWPITEPNRLPDQVWHLAAINGTANFYSRPAEVLEVGVKGIVNVVDACIAAHVPELFVASSSEVYGEPLTLPTTESEPMKIADPLNPRFSYAASKIVTEMYALHHADRFKRVVVFRPHNVYGPDMGELHVVPQLIRRTMSLAKAFSGPGLRHIPIEGNRWASRSFCYIDDCIDALLLLQESGQHKNIYNVGTDKETDIDTLLRCIGKCLEIECTAADHALDSKTGGPRNRRPNIAKLKTLGYAPKIDLEEGLRRTVTWYRENPACQPS